MTATGLESLLAQGPVLAIGTHPDDLTLAASSLLQKARDAHCAIVTTGAKRGDTTGLAELRRAEEIAAMRCWVWHRTGCIFSASPTRTATAG